MQLRFRSWLEMNSFDDDPEDDPEEEEIHNLHHPRERFHPGDPTPRGEKIHRAYGVWMMPFHKAKHDASEGWYFDYFDEPGSIDDLDQVEPGQKIADKALNLTPYWVVTTVD